MVFNISNILNQSIHKAEKVKFQPKRLIIDIDKSECFTPPQRASSIRLEHRQLTSALQRSMDQLQTFRTIRGNLKDIRSNLSQMKDLVVNEQGSSQLVSQLKQLNANINQISQNSELVEKKDSAKLNINPVGHKSDDTI